MEKEHNEWNIIIIGAINSPWLFLEQVTRTSVV